MPIQLTTPLSAGDLSTGVYDHVKIMRQVHDAYRGHIRLDLEYGTIVETEVTTEVDGQPVVGPVLTWETAPVAPNNVAYPLDVTIEGDEYLAMRRDAEPLPGEKTFVASKRGFYEWIQAKYPALVGSII